MQVDEIIGSNVRRAREEAGLSQGRLGEAIEGFLGAAWARQSVSLAESGQRPFRVVELLAIASATGKAPWELVLPPSPSGSVSFPGGRRLPMSSFQALLDGERSWRGSAMLTAPAARLRATASAAREALAEVEARLNDVEEEGDLLDELARTTGRRGR